jgi:hypothetical protein
MLNRRTAAAAAALATLLVLWARAQSPLPLNDRGSTAPGTLEGHWKFDERGGPLALDSSGHALDGRFSNEPKRVPGMLGNAVNLEGASDYAHVGRASAFRLSGSMTISAWIKIAHSPLDDAAIVSTHNGAGYQLDTTVDQGPRTIGFKLGNACGGLMARYGATRLHAGRWYHVAGVYDASAMTLDVYLDGRLDDGVLRGPITRTQLSSREAFYIGRRASDAGFEFGGLIDDVRIYSRALTVAEVEADMRGLPVATPRLPSRRPLNRDQPETAEIGCLDRSDREDSWIPGAAGVLGVLVAVMNLGFWPHARRLPCLVAGAIAGLLLLPGAAPSLPALGRWLIPFTSLAAAFSVTASVSDEQLRSS